MAKAKDAGKKPNIVVGIGLFFKNLVLRILRSFRDMAAELKKVTWPSKKELINYSLVVLAFMAAMAIIIGLIDGGAAALMSFLVRG